MLRAADQQGCPAAPRLMLALPRDRRPCHTDWYTFWTSPEPGDKVLLTPLCLKIGWVSKKAGARKRHCRLRERCEHRPRDVKSDGLSAGGCDGSTRGLWWNAGLEGEGVSPGMDSGTIVTVRVSTISKEENAKGKEQKTPLDETMICILRKAVRN